MRFLTPLLTPFLCPPPIGLFVLAQTEATWNALPFNAPALPLAVKTPYLNTWLSQGSVPVQSGEVSPLFWNIKNNLGWTTRVRVDGQTYSVLGEPDISLGVIPANQTSVSFTATQTVFNHQAGPVAITVAFISPIAPSDFVRQSIPFSYLSVNVTSIDDDSHEVQLYSDITAEWISGDNQLNATWSHSTDGNYIVLQNSLLTPLPFQELNSQAGDATAYYAMAKGNDISWQIATDSISRGLFTTSGTLSNAQDNSFRAISDNTPVFAISVNLGDVQNETSPAVWAVGIVRDPVIQYQTSSGVEQRSSYWLSQFSSVESMIEFFINDYDNAIQSAMELDIKIQNDASAISSNYANLAALSLRQVLASTDITIKKGSSNDWDTTDVKIFMKNIGNVGGGGVNSVDILYAAFPAFLYLNATWGQALLAPLLEYEDSSIYSNPYASQDLGSNYPNATGPSDTPQLAIEETANMLIMTLASAQATGDTSLIARHYNMLRGWSDYLVNNTLYPNLQTTADKFDVANQTNLALKGIIAIGAMAKMSEAVRQKSDQQSYQNIATNYMNQWIASANATNGTHFLSSYNNQESSGIMYNLYADKLLQLNLVPKTAYDLQTSFLNQSATNMYGLALDDSSTVSRTDWSVLAAATVSDEHTQISMINQVNTFAAFARDNHPFDLVYNSSTGAGESFSGGSPAQGGIFAILALNLPIRPINGSNVSFTSPASSRPSGPRPTSDQPRGPVNSKKMSSDIGPIVGAVVGGILGILVVFASVIFYVRRRRVRKVDNGNAIRRRTSISSSFTILPFQVERPETSSYMQGRVVMSKNHPRPKSMRDSLRPSHSLREYDVAYQRSIASGSITRPDEPQDMVYSLHSSSIANLDDVGSSGSQATLLPGDSSSGAGGPSSIRAPNMLSTRVPRGGSQNSQLRTEVENLRLEVDRMRMERNQIPMLEVTDGLEGAPPSYTSQVG